MAKEKVKKDKVKKASYTAFKQQRLKAWQPILTPKTVLPTFFTIGALFIPIGIGLFIASEQVTQVVFDYTKCSSAGPTFAPPNPPQAPITEWKYDSSSRNCTVRFNVTQVLKKPVFMYYRLTNFYQNHRKYVKSFDAKQLKGENVTRDDLAASCGSMPPSDEKVGPGSNISVSGSSQYYPCGLIANSLFIDEIFDPVCSQDNCKSATGETFFSQFNFVQTNIAWPSDKDKFGRSVWADKSDDEIMRNVIPPPNWRNSSAFGGKYAFGYNKANFPNLQEMERLQVWMRTAGLPNFRKLWGRNDNFDMGVGTWEIVVQDNFDVLSFSGTKSIVISTISILGGKNSFLGIAYIFVGGACVLLGIIFLIRHMLKPRKLGDHSFLSWNQK